MRPGCGLTRRGAVASAARDDSAEDDTKVVTCVVNEQRFEKKRRHRLRVHVAVIWYWVDDSITPA